MKRFTFSVPQNILFGEGVLKELPGAAGKLGGKPVSYTHLTLPTTSRV